MPLSYRIEDGIVYTKVAGAFSAQEQIELTRSWLADRDLQSPYLICRDGSDAAPTTADAIRALLSFLSTVSIPVCSKLALVVRDDVNFGMSRMYQTLADGVENLTIEIFRSSEEAVAWLRQGPTSASTRD